MQPLHIDRQAHDIPLTTCFGFPAENESAEAEHGFDPAQHRFDDPTLGYNRARTFLPRTLLTDGIHKVPPRR